MLPVFGQMMVMACRRYVAGRQGWLSAGTGV